MLTRINVERFSVTSSRSLRDVLATIKTAVGHPDMSAFRKNLNAAKTASEMEQAIQAAIGPSGFMEFMSLDLGEVVHKGRSAGVRGIVRLVIGNPLIMKQMVEHVPDAGS
jgi:hypothetical protein